MSVNSSNTVVSWNVGALSIRASGEQSDNLTKCQAAHADFIYLQGVDSKSFFNPVNMKAWVDPDLAYEMLASGDDMLLWKKIRYTMIGYNWNNAENHPSQTPEGRTHCVVFKEKISTGEDFPAVKTLTVARGHFTTPKSEKENNAPTSAPGPVVMEIKDNTTESLDSQRVQITICKKIEVSPSK